MSPLNRRIAYKKKSGFPVVKYLIILIFLSTLIYLLFYYKWENKTIYERAIGFFRSEIEKSPAITILESEKNTHRNKNSDQRNKKPEQDSENQRNNQQNKEQQEKDEIEEIIKKKLK